MAYIEGQSLRKKIESGSLKNRTGDAEQEYYVDGVTEELIGHLAQISGLRRVISRTTVMRYKETDKSLPEIAQELNVDALEEDPDYALAHTGIALVWIRLKQMGLVPPSEATPYMKAAAQRALELDDTLPEVHFALALIDTWTDWDWEAGENSFLRAIELNPNYSLARAYYSNLLCLLGQSDEAIAQAEKALELDPINSLVQGICGNTFALTRRYDDAIFHARNSLRTSPHDPVGHNILWEMLHSKGLYEESLSEAKAFFTGLGLAEIAEVMARGYDQDGYSGAMRIAAETLVALSEETHISPWFISFVYSFAEEKEQALKWLERAYEMKDPTMPYLITPGFDIIRDDPRFQNLLRKMNLSVGK
jgi:tetratricopeptide (TPR) repeat protein